MNILSSISQVKKTTLCAWLIFAAILAYTPSLFNEFIWDDYMNIVDNAALKSPDAMSRLFTSDYITSGDMLARLHEVDAGFGEMSYRPVMTLSLLIDYSIWKMNSFGYHLTSLIFHLLNVLFVFFLAWKLCKNQLSAFLAGLIFAIHPVQHEAVMIASFREDLLALFFFLLAFLAYIKLTETRKLHWYLFSLIGYGLALFSKEMAITLPAILLMYDVWFTNKDSSFIKRIRWQHYVGYVFVAIAFLWVSFGLIGYGKGVLIAFEGGTLFGNVLTMIKVLGTYVIWLITLIEIHPTMSDPNFYVSGLLAPDFWIAVGALLIISGVFWFNRKGRPEISFGLIFFLITLGPVMNIIPMPNLIAPRYLYLPIVGFCIAMAVIARPFLEKYIRYSSLILIGVSLFYVISTITLGFYCSSELGFRLNMVENYPSNPKAYYHVAQAYDRIDRHDKSVEYLFKTAQLEGNDSATYFDIVDQYLLLNQTEAAIDVLRNFVKNNPDSVEGADKLCSLYGKNNQLQKSVECYEVVIARKPIDSHVYFNQAINFELLGDQSRSRILLEKALEIDPDFTAARERLAN